MEDFSKFYVQTEPKKKRVEKAYKIEKVLTAKAEVKKENSYGKLHKRQLIQFRYLYSSPNFCSLLHVHQKKVNRTSMFIKYTFALSFPYNLNFLKLAL